MQDVIIGTAGHIDHGKTTLVKALTGIDPDRLEEEKRRGITIDIGFAHLELGSFRLGFVDVPGHEKFVKNMLAGVGGIDLVVLVVAADESVMPQTLEHFHICRLLEIPRGMVVVTKKGLVDEELLDLVREEVRQLARGSFLEGAPVVAVDSLRGEGLEELRRVLLAELEDLSGDKAARASRAEVFRMPIDRVFTIRGFGTVVTGTPVAGEFRKDDTLAVYPTRKEGKIRGIEIFNRKVDSGRAGQRAALNLAGLEKQDLERGMVLGPPSAFEPSSMFDVWLHLLEGAPRPLTARTPVRFHQGTAELIGRVYLLEGPSIQPGQSGLAQIRIEKPTLSCPRDRFILRAYSPVTTIGGGVILDNAPPKHRGKERTRSAAGLRRLASLWLSRHIRFDETLVGYLVESRGRQGLNLRELAARTGLQPGYLSELLRTLEAVRLIPQDPPLAVHSSGLEETLRNLPLFLEDFHGRNPLAAGVSREELRKRFLGAASGAYLQAVLEELEARGKVRVQGSLVALKGKHATLSGEQQKIREQIVGLFDSRKLQPPTLDELVDALPFPASQIRDLYYFLLQEGELVRVQGDLVLAGPQVDFLKAELQKVFPKGQTFSVGEFKEVFNVSRKYAIPFLEFLDRERITRRMGDKRMVV